MRGATILRVRNVRFTLPCRTRYDRGLTTCGPVAQLGARMNGIHEVTGSIPVWSTTPFISTSIGRK